MPAPYRTRPGWRYPPGATADANGTNFSVFSRHATDVELLLYERADSPEPFQIVVLDPEVHRTFFFWHVYLEGLPPGTHYTWRVDGPKDPAGAGTRFDRGKELLDPWARAVTSAVWDRVRASQPGDAGHSSLRAVVVNDGYDWEGDAPLRHPFEQCVIYEVHVGGLTRHPSSGVARPGTFAGVIEKIPYLKELGVTDVELLPVMAFDEQDVPPGAAQRGLTNYWGYSPIGFYSPHPGYCVDPSAGSHRREFRDMVKALHRAGIGVIIDVVFNHTAEGGADGPTIHFKGLGNEMFYHLEPGDRSRYRDYSGCGNALNCSHPFVTRYLVECLEYWVREMHVDGFRFDLASVLVRGEDGAPLWHAPTPWNIEFSDALAYTKLIAEAWDAGGLYQVGGFPGYRWAEWNGRYRDVVRRFVRGERGLIGELATRLSGSSDLYAPAGRLPINSINFVTCHDGFTLWDLVSYDTKHNEANGEGGRDGSEQNLSWNGGVEGETGDPEVNGLRRRQARNFLAILLLSQGVPMLLAGDEVLRTQGGNNNAYCQDNPTSWLDWTLLERNRPMLEFVRGMIALRRRHPSLMRRRFLAGQRRAGARMPDICWHGGRLFEPPWDDPEAQVLAFTLAAVEDTEEDLHCVLNMSDEPVDAALPEAPGRVWHRAVDTVEEGLAAIPPRGDQPRVEGGTYRTQPRSVAVLEARPAPGPEG
jgi:glycogen operon protein